MPHGKVRVTPRGLQAPMKAKSLNARGREGSTSQKYLKPRSASSELRKLPISYLCMITLKRPKTHVA